MSQYPSSILLLPRMLIRKTSACEDRHPMTQHEIPCLLLLCITYLYTQVPTSANNVRHQNNVRHRASHTFTLKYRHLLSPRQGTRHPITGLTFCLPLASTETPMNRIQKRHGSHGCEGLKLAHVIIFPQCV